MNFPTLNPEAPNIQSNRVQHLAPLHNMPLTELNGSDNLASDLWPLRGMPLQRLDLANTAVFDLAPLQGMPLRVLNVRNTAVRDIGAVKGMPLDELNAGNLGLTSLAPLRGSPVKRLILHDNRLHDLAPLRDSFVQMLNLVNTPVSDLGPLFGTPLEELSIERTQVSDLTPLHRSPLRVLTCDAGHQYAGMAPLRNLPTLEWVNPRPGPDLRAAAFWQRWDAAACRYTTNGPNVTVVGYTGTGGAVTLASRVGGRHVVAIGDNAFANCTNVTEVSIPDSVTSIHGNAFVGCTKLASFAVAAANPVYTNSSDGVIFSRDWKRLVCFPPGRGGTYAPPHGVVEIGESAFRGRPVENVILPVGVTTIGGWAFGGCGSLTNIIIPQGVTKICGGTFEWCGRLRTARLPDSVMHIGGYAFYHCSSLDIEIPASVVQIDDEAFGWTSRPVFVPASVITMDRNPFAYWSSRTEFTVDPANPAFQSVDGVIYNKQKTRIVSYPTGREGTYAIHPGVQTIAGRAFYGARIGHVNIPRSVKSIEHRAFRRCRRLKGIYFEGDAPKLGRDALSDIPTGIVHHRAGAKGFGESFGGLPTAIWDPDNPFVFVKTNGVAILKQYQGPGGDVMVPGTVDGLPLTEVGARAFANWPALRSARLPDTVTHIRNGAFAECSSLEDILLPESVEQIEGGVFAGCTNLRRIVFSPRVRDVGWNLLMRCDHLEMIEVDAANPHFRSDADGVAFSKDGTRLVRFPSGRPGPYIVPQTVAQIGACAFEGSAGVTEVTIPQSVTAIEDYTFKHCGNLARIMIPASVTSIGYQAFYGCGKLDSLIFDGDAPSLGRDSLAHCPNATVYYRSGAKGWGETFGGRPTKMRGDEK